MNEKFFAEVRAIVKDSGETMIAWTNKIGSANVSARTIRAALLGEVKLSFHAYMYVREKALLEGKVIAYSPQDYYDEEKLYYGFK